MLVDTKQRCMCLRQIEALSQISGGQNKILWSRSDVLFRSLDRLHDVPLPLLHGRHQAGGQEGVGGGLL
jgi:hypothetical protein